jgi:hypothetical protein
MADPARGWGWDEGRDGGSPRMGIRRLYYGNDL